MNIEEELKCLDITAPQMVEVEIDHARNVLYVHVDGITRLRVCRCKIYVKHTNDDVLSEIYDDYSE